MRSRLLIVGTCALFVTAPAVSQDVRNTYIAVAAQVADNTITLAKLNGLGTGIATALGINIGSAGSPVINGGALGTPSSGTATNLSGTAASLTSGTVTTNANLTGDITSVGNATTLAAGSASNLNSGTLPVARLGGLNSITNSLVADVNLNNTANFFDGPSIAQGTTGTWWASGSVTVTDTAVAAIFCKLWDGTTIIDAGRFDVVGANANGVISLSGYLAAPQANIRISCRDASTTAGQILATSGGIVTKSATVSAFRIQ